MKRVVLYLSDKCPHCRQATKYQDDNDLTTD
jgi:peroxiredoxin